MKKPIRFIGAADAILLVGACLALTAPGCHGASETPARSPAAGAREGTRRGVAPGPGTRALWSRAFNRCTGRDVLGDDVLYFGPSMDVDPGTIWQKSLMGHWKPTWRLEDLGIQKFPGAAVRGGVSTHCTDWAPATFVLDGAGELDEVLPGLDPDVAADLRKATKIVVRFDAYRWDSTHMEPYAKLIAAEKPDLKKEILADSNFVQTESLRIQDMLVYLTFDAALAKELAAKYQPGQNLASSAAGGVFVLKFTAATLAVKGVDSYIAGAFIRRSQMPIDELLKGDADKAPGELGLLVRQLKGDTGLRVAAPEGMFVRGLTDAKIDGP